MNEPPPQSKSPLSSPTTVLPVVDEQQRAIIAQIMSLTDDQIAALPEQQRAQVLQVREQILKSQQV